MSQMLKQQKLLFRFYVSGVPEGLRSSYHGLRKVFNISNSNCFSYVDSNAHYTTPESLKSYIQNNSVLKAKIINFSSLHKYSVKVNDVYIVENAHQLTLYDLTRLSIFIIEQSAVIIFHGDPKCWSKDHGIDFCFLINEGAISYVTPSCRAPAPKVDVDSKKVYINKLSFEELMAKCVNSDFYSNAGGVVLLESKEKIKEINNSIRRGLSIPSYKDTIVYSCSAKNEHAYGIVKEEHVGYLVVLDLISKKEVKINRSKCAINLAYCISWDVSMQLKLSDIVIAKLRPFSHSDYPSGLIYSLWAYNLKSRIVVLSEIGHTEHGSKAKPINNLELWSKEPSRANTGVY